MKNWKTTLTGIGGAITSTLTVLAALPAQIGELSTVMPEEWKPIVIKLGLLSTLALRILNGICSKDAAPAPVEARSTVLTRIALLMLLPAFFCSGCVSLEGGISAGYKGATLGVKSTGDGKAITGDLDLEEWFKDSDGKEIKVSIGSGEGRSKGHSK